MIKARLVSLFPPFSCSLFLLGAIFTSLVPTAVWALAVVLVVCAPLFMVLTFTFTTSVEVPVLLVLRACFSTTLMSSRGPR